jgi:hypothetical protein
MKLAIKIAVAVGIIVLGSVGFYRIGFHSGAQFGKRHPLYHMADINGFTVVMGWDAREEAVVCWYGTVKPGATNFLEGKAWDIVRGAIVGCQALPEELSK